MGLMMANKTFVFFVSAAVQMDCLATEDYEILVGMPFGTVCTNRVWLGG
jgi:hypothetical protein